MKAFVSTLGVVLCFALVACDDSGGAQTGSDASGGGASDGGNRDAAGKETAASPPDAGMSTDGAPPAAPDANASADGLDGATDVPLSDGPAAVQDSAPPIPGIEAGVAACDFGAAGSAATTGTTDLFGTIVYYNGGNPLPAGRYVVTYLDGCMKYGGGQGWTIHAYEPPSLAWYLVGDTSANRVIAPPGTVGYAAGSGAFATFDECVAANKALPPKEFDFAGGKLGVWLNDSPYSDNMVGEGGRNPKWQLARLGACLN